MNANARRFITIVLSASMGLFATSTLAQTSQASAGGSNTSGQATQSTNGSAPDTSSSKASAKPSETPSPEPSLGDVARKLKQKNQESQNGGQTHAEKSHVYTNDDFSAGKTVSAHGTRANASTKPTTTGSKPSAPAANEGPANIVITRFEPEKSTVRRPGGTQMNWMIENHSDHTVHPTVTFIVTGPCHYKSELPTNPEMGPGYGLAHNGFQVVLSESDCAGQYSLELRVTVGGQVVTAASSVNAL